MNRILAITLAEATDDELTSQLEVQSDTEMEQRALHADAMHQDNLRKAITHLNNAIRAGHVIELILSEQEKRATR